MNRQTARDVLASCRSVREGAAATLEECRRSLAEREAGHARAETARAIAEADFDREPNERTAGALAAAREKLEGADLLVERAKERLGQAERSDQTAREAVVRAEREVKTLELNAKLEERFDVEEIENAYDCIGFARKMLGEAAGVFAEKIGALFKRLDEDERARAELAQLGVHTAPTSALHLVGPILRGYVAASRLAVDARPTWRVLGGGVLRGPTVGPSLATEPVTIQGYGALTAALGSLDPLRKAIAKRDSRAVLAELEQLTRAEVSGDVAKVGRELVSLLEQHRSDEEIVSVIAAIEQSERERLRLEGEQRAAAGLEEARRLDAEYARRYVQTQARMGNAYAKRLSGQGAFPSYRAEIGGYRVPARGK